MGGRANDSRGTYQMAAAGQSNRARSARTSPSGGRVRRWRSRFCTVTGNGLAVVGMPPCCAGWVASPPGRAMPLFQAQAGKMVRAGGADRPVVGLLPATPPARGIRHCSHRGGLRAGRQCPLVEADPLLAIALLPLPSGRRSTARGGIWVTEPLSGACRALARRIRARHWLVQRFTAIGNATFGGWLGFSLATMPELFRRLDASTGWRIPSRRRCWLCCWSACCTRGWVRRCWIEGPIPPPTGCRDGGAEPCHFRPGAFGPSAPSALRWERNEPMPGSSTTLTIPWWSARRFNLAPPRDFRGRAQDRLHHQVFRPAAIPFAAQGGIAASLCNNTPDHWTWHVRHRQGVGLAGGDQDAIEYMVRKARRRFTSWSTPACLFAQCRTARSISALRRA